MKPAAISLALAALLLALAFTVPAAAARPVAAHRHLSQYSFAMASGNGNTATSTNNLELVNPNNAPVSMMVTSSSQSGSDGVGAGGSTWGSITDGGPGASVKATGTHVSQLASGPYSLVQNQANAAGSKLASAGQVGSTYTSTTSNVADAELEAITQGPPGITSTSSLVKLFRPGP